MNEKTQDNTSQPPKKKKPDFFSFENLRSIGILILVIFAIRWSIASPYHVPTASMEPTIKVGDRLLAFKLSYNFKIPYTEFVVAQWATPKRGDIIVFRYPNNPDIDYVKRVVAIGGDEIKFVNNILYINGDPQPRTDHNQDRSVLDDIEDSKQFKDLYVERLDGRSHWVMQNIASYRQSGKGNWPSETSSFKVPEGSVFCVGDNRDNSHDSRIWKEVSLSYVRGKALFVLWSWYFTQDSALPVIRFRRFGHWLDGEFSN